MLFQWIVGALNDNFLYLGPWILLSSLQCPGAQLPGPPQAHLQEPQQQEEERHARVLGSTQLRSTSRVHGIRLIGAVHGVRLIEAVLGVHLIGGVHRVHLI